MRRALALAFVANLAISPLHAETKAITGHPSKLDIGAVANTFRSTMKQGGMQLTSQSIQACYDTPNLAPFQRVLCVLWDAAAMSMDAAQRRTMMARGLADPGSVTPFLSAQAYAARRATYGVLLFGTQPGAQEQYLGNAPGQALELMLR